VLKRSIHFIINPISGNASQGKEVTKFDWSRIFCENQFDLRFHFTTHAGHGAQLTDELLLLRPHMIVACGGDGTINEISRQMVGSEIPLGLIPRGSGNGFATHLEIPSNLEKAAEILRRGRVGKVDTGIINDRLFLSNIGLGFAAEVIEQYSNLPGRRFHTYFRAGLSALGKVSQNELYQLLDSQGKVCFAASQIIVANSNMLGYGISATPAASLMDGMLDVVAYQPGNIFAFLIFCFQILNKTHMKNKSVFNTQMAELTFTRQNGSISKIQIDGEPWTTTVSKFKVRISPHSLKIVIP